MGFEDEPEQSLGRPCRQDDGRSKRTCELTSSIVPRGTSFHRSVEFKPGGMKVFRLYADALGESRFETTTMPMALKEFAPPAAPFRLSDPQPAKNYVILEVDAAWGGAVPHPSPARMMAFSLSGCTRVTASSGESHIFVTGDCLLHDDTSGKGHSTEVISDVPARWVFTRLPN
jgi:hypothetical protein